VTDAEPRLTRDTLIDVGRVLFGARGYRATSVDALAAAAGVSKAAIYRHFAHKRDLFEAVYAAEQQRLTRLMSDRCRREADPIDGCVAAVRVFLEACLDLEAQRINLFDAPAVLGWDGARRISSGCTFQLIEGALEQAMREGLTPRRPVRPVAHVVFGAVSESACLIAEATDQRHALEQAFDEFRRLIAAVARPSGDVAYKRRAGYA
jgi:AcrR family transcriptional regulator